MTQHAYGSQSAARGSRGRTSARRGQWSLWRPCAAIWLLPLLAGAARAAVPPENGPRSGSVLTLEDMVVTGSRESQPAASVPASLTAISAEDIAKLGATSVLEVLERLGGIQVRSYSGNAADAEISMRGFGENSHSRVLVLKDGHRLNRPDMSAVNWLEVPLAAIERIEILRGSHSALYGNHAVGGVINIITKRGQVTAARPRVTLRGVVGSHGLHQEAVRLSGAVSGIAYETGIQRLSNDGYRERSAFRDTNGTLELRLGLSEAVTARLGVSRSDRAYELPGPLPTTLLAQDRTAALNQYDQGEATTSTLRLGLELADALGGTLSLDGSLRRTEQEWNLGSFPFEKILYGTFGETRITTIAITPKYTLRRELGGHDVQLTLGVDYYHDELSTRSYPNEHRHPTLTNGRLTRDTLGVYGRQEIQLWQGATLALGARKEWSWLDAVYREPGQPDAGYDDSTRSDESAFSVGVNQALAAQVRLFGRVERFYRYPATDEIAAYQGYGTAVPFNSSLAAEKGINWEAGIDLGPWRGVSLALTGFLMTVDNEIYWDGSRNTNYDEQTRRTGVEVRGRWQAWGGLSFSGSYTWLDAVLQGGATEGWQLPLVPQEKMNLGMEWEFLRDFLLVVDMQYTGGFYQGSGEWGYQWPKLSSYRVWNAVLHYRPRRFSAHELDVFVGADNLLAEEYVSTGFFGGLYPAPERILKAGMSVSF